MNPGNDKMGAEDVAEDLSDPAVQMRLAEFIKNRHYPADTYRIQDSCANCRHVSTRKDCDGATYVCTFAAQPKGESVREVLPEGICWEWAPT